MSAKLNIETHIAKHEECIKILDMIKRNRNYMLSAIAESVNPFWADLHGKNYYTAKIEMRKKIQHRLLGYYAKKVAAIGSDAYNVALDLRKPQLPTAEKIFEAVNAIAEEYRVNNNL